MKLSLTSEKKIIKPPVNIINVNDKIFCLMKSNKVYDVTNHKYIQLHSTLTAITANNDSIFCFSNGSYARLHLETGKLSKNNRKLDVSAVSFSYNEKKIVCGLKDGKIILTDDQLKTSKTLYGVTNRISDINCSLRNKVICCSLIDHFFYVFDIKTTDMKKIKVKRGFISALDVFKKRYVVVGVDEGFVYVYDLEKDKIVYEFYVEGNITCIKVMNNHVFMGTLQNDFLIYHLMQDKKDMNIFTISFEEKHTLDGSINCFNIYSNKIYVGTGREEKFGSYNKKKDNKNKIYTFSIK